MIFRLWAAAVVIAATFVFAPAPLSAAPIAPLPAATAGSLIEEVYFGRCRYWRHECAARWGWRTPRYFRCLARHWC